MDITGSGSGEIYFAALQLTTKYMIINILKSITTTVTMGAIYQKRQLSSERILILSTYEQSGGGGSHIDMVYVYVPAFWGAFSRNLV